MKKFYYSLFAAATMLLATSCSQEEDFGQQSSGELTSFSVKLENATGSRAVGDGTTATKLYYEVYRGSECIIDQNVAINTTASIEMPLLKGEKYDIIFWAQSANGIYKVENLKEITVDYQSPKANMEDYDAFYNALNEFTADGKTHTIELRRPFAQLNLGTSDWEKAKEGLAANGNTDEVPVTHTQVTVKGLATSFSPLTGIATGDAGEVTFAYNELPSQETLTVDNVSYKYLSLNYLLVESTNEPQGLEAYVQKTADSKTNVDLVFALKRGETALFELNIPNAPVQRNWRTNVVGALLTGSEFDVIIKPETDGNYGSADILQETLNKGGEVTLTYNVALDSYLTIPENVEVTLNLNGYSITAESGNCIRNNGTLTITGEGTIKSKSTYAINNVSGTVTVESGNIGAIFNGGKLTVNDGVIANTVSGKHGIYHDGSTLTINGGTFTSTSGNELINDATSTTGDVVINAGSFTQIGKSYLLGATNAGIIINGGTFNGYVDANGNNDKMRTEAATIKGGTFNFDPTQWVAEGNKVITKTDKEGNNLYYVVPEGMSDVVTISSVVDLAAFAANVNNGETFKGQTIVLAADLDLNHAAWTPIGDCTSGKYFQGTFDGQGYTISNLNVDKSTDSNEHSTAGLFGWVDAAGATIKNVKVDGATVKGSHWTGVIAGYFTGRIENCTVTNATVEGFNVTEDANGDKVGGIVGCLNEHSYINGNSVSKSTIKGNRDIGGIAGSVAASTYEMKDNTVTDVTITFITAKDYASAGAIVSGRTGYVPNTTNVATNVTIKQVATTAAELSTAITAGLSEIYLPANTEIRMPSNAASTSIKIIGDGTSTIDVSWGAYLENATLIFENVKFKTGTGYVTSNGTKFGSDYAALYSKNVTYNECNFSGPMRLGRDGAKFTKCTFNDLGNDYVWTYGNAATFKDCIFNTEGKALLIYSDGNDGSPEVSVTGCTFNATKSAMAGAIANQNCAAIEIDNYGKGVNLTTSGNTIDSDFSGEWRIKGIGGNDNVTVNETQYNTLALDGKIMTIDANKNVTVNE